MKEITEIFIVEIYDTCLKCENCSDASKENCFLSKKFEGKLKEHINKIVKKELKNLEVDGYDNLTDEEILQCWDEYDRGEPYSTPSDLINALDKLPNLSLNHPLVKKRMAKSHSEMVEEIKKEERKYNRTLPRMWRKIKGH